MNAPLPRRYPVAVLCTLLLACAAPPPPAALAPAYFPDTAAVFDPAGTARVLLRLGLAPLARGASDTASLYRLVSFQYVGGALAYIIHQTGDSAWVEYRSMDPHGKRRSRRGSLSRAAWAQLAAYEADWQVWSRRGRGAAWLGTDGGVILLESLRAGEYQAWSAMTSDQPLEQYQSWLAYQLDLALHPR